MDCANSTSPLRTAHCRYRRVMHACALERDLEIMADGDLTEIGERGANISGGQAQRIALARAAYSGAELYVLDAPLSAVDQYTLMHIMKYAIRGVLAGRTILLVTHKVELLPSADVVIVMEGGSVTHCGPYNAFVADRFGGPRPAEFLEGADSQLASAVGKGKDRAETIPFDEVLRVVDEATLPAGHRARAPSVKQSPTLLPGSFSPRRHAASTDAAPPLPSIAESLGISRGEELHTLERAYSIRASAITSIVGSGSAFVNAPPTGTAAAVALERQRSSTLGGRSNTSSDAPASPEPHFAKSSSQALVSARKAAPGHIVRGESTVDPSSRPDPHANIKPLGAGGKAKSLRPKRPAATAPRVAGGPYSVLLKEVGYLLALSSFLVFVVTQLVRIFSDYWISRWVEDKCVVRWGGGSWEHAIDPRVEYTFECTPSFNSYKQTTEWYLGVYGGYVGTFMVALFIRGIYFFAIVRRAASGLHNKMFEVSQLQVHAWRWCSNVQAFKQA
jgi:hypothetical protein